MSESHTPGTLVLIGSGEFAPTMGKIHRQIASWLDEPLRAVFVDTPAGFENNVAGVADKAVAYLERHLGVHSEVASFRSKESAAPADVQSALRRIDRANYILAGPGSPTYAARNWAGTEVFEAMARRLDHGALLVCASAAAIAMGAHTLPVYEIFKAGLDLGWAPGLGLLEHYGLRPVIVPHWNNGEGAGYDTRCCFMGVERFRRLEAMLPNGTTVLGIDEYTALAIDLGKGECRVIGQGSVYVRRAGNERTAASGDTFALAELRDTDAVSGELARKAASTADPRASLDREVASTQQFLAKARNPSIGEYASRAYGLAVAIDHLPAVTDATGARELLGELLEHWTIAITPAPANDATADIRPFVDLLVRVRAMLRAEGRWALSDAIRDGLAGLGVQIVDSKTDSTWTRQRTPVSR